MPPIELIFISTSSGPSDGVNTSTPPSSRLETIYEATQTPPPPPLPVPKPNSMRDLTSIVKSRSMRTSNQTNARSSTIRAIPVALASTTGKPTGTNSSKLSTTIVSTILSTLATNTKPPPPPPPSSTTLTSQIVTTPNITEIDQSVIDYEDSIYTNRMNDAYRPDVGIRTGLILASMLLLIVLYLLWRNRCRCIRGNNGSSSSDDLDMDYWLKYVDKQRAAAAAQKRNLYRSSATGNVYPSPTLPEVLTDPREATAAWIHEHRKIWTQMGKTRAAARTHTHPGHHHALLGNNEPVVAASGGMLDHILRASASSAAVLPARQPSHHSLQGGLIRVKKVPSGTALLPLSSSESPSARPTLFQKLVNPFKKRVPDPVQVIKAKKANILNKRRRSHALGVTVGSGGGPFEDLEAQTQLLINYARVDASSKHTRFGKQLSDVLSNVVRHHPVVQPPASSHIELKPVNTTSSGGGGQQAMPPPSQQLLPLPPQLLIEDTSFNSCSSPPGEPDENDSRQQQLMRHALLSILLVNRRRRHSWPRCKHDNLQFNNFNREVRWFFQQQQQQQANNYRADNELEAANDLLEASNLAHTSSSLRSFSQNL